MTESLGTGLFNQQFVPFRLVISAGAGNINHRISHPGDEFIHCLEGVVEYSIGAQIYRLEQGDSLLFDATQQHAYRNPAQTPATILLLFQATQENTNAHQTWQHEGEKDKK